jgi:hypothetical protein
MNSATPISRSIPADAEILLGTRAGQERREPGREQSRIGFTRDDRIGGPHTRTLAWYAGTVDLGLLGSHTRFLGDSQIPIIDRLSEVSTAALSDPVMSNA